MLDSNICLGLKLEANFSNHNEWQEVFRGIKNPFSEIAALGFQGVEFSLREDLEERQLSLLVKECLEAGLKVNFHPYTGRDVNPACFRNQDGNLARERGRQFLEISHRTSRAQKRKTALILHGASLPNTSGKDKEFLSRQSNNYFKYLDKYAREQNLDVLILAELQLPPLPEEELFRVGDSYGEVLKIIKETQAGICWDTGHAYFGNLRRKASLIPPDDFLRKVKHVHLHDISGGEDHQVLSAGTIPLAEYCALLKKFKFRGDITLEFSPRAISARGKFQDVMQDSLERVQSAWK